MKEIIYIKMNIEGCRGMYKKPPALKGDERSIAIAINVSDSIFDYTFMKTELTIDEDDVITPSLEVELVHCNDKL